MMEKLPETGHTRLTCSSRKASTCTLLIAFEGHVVAVVIVTRGFQAKHLKEGSRVLKPQYNCPLHITVSQRNNYLSRKSVNSNQSLISDRLDTKIIPTSMTTE
jgi:hypothetical protein